MSDTNKMSNVRGSYWSVTINNPTAKDEEEIALARQKRWSVEGQKEKGEEGTPHYQLLVRTPQVRFAALKKAFSRAHIELARTPAALAKYVQKEETRIGQLLDSQDQYPSLSKLWDLIYDYLTKNGKNIYLDPEFGPMIEVWDDDRQQTVDWSPQDPLISFDMAVKSLILKGYHVESMAVNPQVRASWKNYWFELLHRCLQARTTATPPETIVSQTDNIADTRVEFNVPTIHNTDATDEEEIRIPPEDD